MIAGKTEMKQERWYYIGWKAENIPVLWVRFKRSKNRHHKKVTVA